MDEFAIYQAILKREGLGIYRGSIGRRLRLFYPGELESREVQPPQKRADISLPLHLLTEREREVVYCLYYDRRSERETAKYLGLSRATVRTYRQRALRKLKKSLTAMKYMLQS